MHPLTLATLVGRDVNYSNTESYQGDAADEIVGYSESLRASAFMAKKAHSTDPEVAQYIKEAVELELELEKIAQRYADFLDKYGKYDTLSLDEKEHTKERKRAWKAGQKREVLKRARTVENVAKD